MISALLVSCPDSLDSSCSISLKDKILRWQNKTSDQNRHKRFWFSSFLLHSFYMYMSCIINIPVFLAYEKTKAQISCTVTAQLISAFVFATWIVQSLYFLNPKFQASSYLLWLYSPLLSWTWSETSNTCFLGLIFFNTWFTDFFSKY